MEHCQRLPNRYAMILDTETIKGVLAHIAELRLSRRECHPLDEIHGNRANPDLEKYDAEVDAATLADEICANMETMGEAEWTSISEHADFADDNL